jgi:hypothetical protein
VGIFPLVIYHILTYMLHSSWQKKKDIELWEYSLKWPLIDQLHDIQIWGTLGHDPNVDEGASLKGACPSRRSPARPAVARGPVETVRNESSKSCLKK